MSVGLFRNLTPTGPHRDHGSN